MLKNRVFFLFPCLFLLITGCASNPPKDPKAKATISKGEVAQQIGTIEGALISEDIQAGPMTPAKDKEPQKDKTIIVQCPSCHQRVDVTGLPRDAIRCPNCNSLFTY